MLDHSYSGEKQEFVVDAMAEQWVTPTANVFASRINWHQIVGEDAAAAAVLKVRDLPLPANPPPISKQNQAHNPH